MVRLLLRCALFVSSLLAIPIAFADDSCSVAATYVIYVNGIQNTAAEAETSRLKLQLMLDASATRSTCTDISDNSGKRNFIVELSYNPQGWGDQSQSSNLLNPLASLISYAEDPAKFALWNVGEYQQGVLDTSFGEDVSELFLLKYAEEKYASDYAKIVTGYGGTASVDQYAAGRIMALAPNAMPGFNTLENNGVTSAQMTSLYETLFGRSDGTGLIQRLDSHPNAIVVAHSEGNFIANLAYAYYAAMRGNDVAKKIQVVNVANLTQFTPSGFNLTHDKDKAVFGDLGMKYIPANLGLYRRMNNCTDSSCADPAAWSNMPFNVPDATFGTSSSYSPTVGHSFADVYMSSTTATPVSSNVPFTFGKDTFANRLEDMIYAGATTLAKLNLPPPPPPPQPTLQHYVDTNFSGGVQNMWTWGSSPRYDSGAQAYVIETTDGFGVSLPPNQRYVEVKARMMLIASDDQPNQYMFDFDGNVPGTVGTVMFEFLHNAGMCGSQGYNVLKMSGDPTPWQCDQNLGFDMRQFINQGWVDFSAVYDRASCTASIALNRVSDGYGDGHSNIPLTSAQCNNERGAVVFSPGSPNHNALMIFQSLKIDTIRAN